MAQPDKIVLYTGNIFDKEELIRKVGQSTAEELRGGVKTTLNSWNRGGRISDNNYGNENELIIKPKEKKQVIENSRGIKTTLKIFLSSNDANRLSDAITTIKQEFDECCIHSLILAPPDVSDDFTLDILMPLWRVLEDAVDDGNVVTIGISDVSSELFQQLYQDAKIKPSTIQVNLSSCCTIPKDLEEYAKSHDVQILTHADDSDIIDEDVVENILNGVGLPGVQCEVMWLARHRTVQTCYGVIVDKGYSICLSCGDNII